MYVVSDGLDRFVFTKKEVCLLKKRGCYLKDQKSFVDPLSPALQSDLLIRSQPPCLHMPADSVCI